MKLVPLALMLSLSFLGVAKAQSYPERDVTIVVPFAAGGGVDSVARPLAEGLRRQLGRAFLIENRAGAATNLGSSQVARANADGYTLLVNLDIIAAFPQLYPKLTYNPLKDLTPVAYVASAPMVLVVHPSLPVYSVEDLVRLAKKDPSKLTFAIPGLGTPHHLAFELLQYKAGFKIRSVGYRGGGPALTDVLGGHVHMGVFTIGTVTALIQSGQLRPLAVTSPNRSSIAPAIPTLAEAGFASAQITNQYVMMAPANTPSAIIEKLNLAVAQVLATSEVSEIFRQQGFEPIQTSPLEARKLMEDEQKRWIPVIEAANIKLE